MLKNYFKDKTVGFYLTIATTILSLVLAIMLVVMLPQLADLNKYGYTNNMPVVYVCLFGLVALTIVGIIFKKFALIPYAQASLSFVGLLFFIYSCYAYFFEIFMAIEEMVFYPIIIAFAIMFIVIIALSVAGIFLKQTKNLGEVSHE